MRIRITGRGLPKAQFAGQQGGNQDDAWIRKILEYEAQKGSATGGGLSNFGYNNWQKLGHKHPPRSLDEAVEYYKKDFLPKVQHYPMGLRERMGDYIFNTGRNPNDLLLYNAGKITLDQLNSPNTFTNEWNQFGSEIEKQYSNPNFINSLDANKENVYKTTGTYDAPDSLDPTKKVKTRYSLTNPNPAFTATWQGRTNMWGKYSAPTQTTPVAPVQQPTPAQTVQPVTQSTTQSVTQPTTQTATQSNAPTTLIYNGALINANDPRYSNLMNQSSSFLNSGRQRLGLQNADKISALKAAGPQLPKLTFKPFENSGQAAASINPFTPSTTAPSTTTQNAVTTPFNVGSVSPWGSILNRNEPYIDSNDQVWGSNPGIVTREDTEALGFGQNAPAPPAPSKFAKAANWYSKNIGDPLESVFQDLDRYTALGNFGTELVNSYKRKQDFDKRLRRQTSTDSLFPEVPSEMSGNRGDYVVSGSRFGEFRPDEYVVNKGMYTGQFLPRMAQYGGGVIPEALTMPIDPIELSAPMSYPTSAPSEANTGSSAPASSSGVNPVAEQTWEEVSKTFPGVKHLGIWGDKRHQKSKSDHNTGDALDIGIKDSSQGEQIAQKLIKEAQDKNIKYIIWNKQIWNPSISNSWRPYSGENPHTTHVHVSFNRPSQSVGEGEIALTHNNPLNIHHGDFTSKYGGKQGSKDAGGYVSIFPDFQTGIQAAKDLLFGPAYSNLTISQARNKWVSGSPDKTNASTQDIVKTMGTDKVLSDLSPAERDKLIKQFARWEGKQAYQKLSGMQLYADGGSISYREGDIYELTEDQIKSILSSGGDIEFL